MAVEHIKATVELRPGSWSGKRRSEANANVNVLAYLPKGSAQWKQSRSSKRHLFGTGWLDESVFDAAGLLAGR
ncbi:hypothetical protein PQR75_42580 [Paraburkholderia fungorum]|uniref:hypothetical protein n=1 Tax=Paraburkholderia fungorum TaxID=134537 RepID=UPI0038BB3E61